MAHAQSESSVVSGPVPSTKVAASFRSVSRASSDLDMRTSGLPVRRNSSVFSWDVVRLSNVRPMRYSSRASPLTVRSGFAVPVSFSYIVSFMVSSPLCLCVRFQYSVRWDVQLKNGKPRAIPNGGIAGAFGGGEAGQSSLRRMERSTPMNPTPIIRATMDTAAAPATSTPVLARSSPVAVMVLLSASTL